MTEGARFDHLGRPARSRASTALVWSLRRTRTLVIIAAVAAGAVACARWGLGPMGSEPDGAPDAGDADADADAPADADADADEPVDADASDADADAAEPVDETITPTIAASRLQGVAPLYVFFDATGSVASGVAAPFHELHYTWDFGDEGAGAFTTTGAPRNRAVGAVAAHVFERPGSYRVEVTVRRRWDRAARAAVEVVVEDPDELFAGDATVCFSTSGDFAGAPAGAELVVESDLAAIVARAAPGRRLLLRRGETFTARGIAAINVAGPGILGSFGDGALPRLTAPEAGKVIMLSDVTPALRDWRFVDLWLDGEGVEDRDGMWGYGEMSQILFLRVAVTDSLWAFQVPVGILDYHNSTTAPLHELHDEIAVVECRVSSSLGVAGAVQIAGHHVALLGNQLELDAGSDALVDVEFGDRMVVAHNELASGASRALGVHAGEFGSTGLLKGISSQWIIAADNAVAAGGGFEEVLVGPRWAGIDQRVQDVIVERNALVASASNSSMVSVAAPDVTVRNNVFDLSPAPASVAVAIASPAGAPGVSAVSVYHNSAFSGASGAASFAVVDSPDRPVTCSNNLLVAPAATSFAFLASGGTTVATTGNLGTAAACLSGSPPVEATDFQLLPSCAAVDAGEIVPVLDDLAGSSRPQGAGPDVGALETW